MQVKGCILRRTILKGEQIPLQCKLNRLPADSTKLRWCSWNLEIIYRLGLFELKQSPDQKEVPAKNKLRDYAAKEVPAKKRPQCYKNSILLINKKVNMNVKPKPSPCTNKKTNDNVLKCCKNIAQAHRHTTPYTQMLAAMQMVAAISNVETSNS